MSKAEPTRRNLTEAFIKGVRAGPRRALYWDAPRGAATSSGMALCVHPTGKRTFKSVYRMSKNKLIWTTIGTWPAIGLAGARAINREIQLQAAVAKHGRAAYPHEEREQAAEHDARPTVRAVAAEWIGYARRTQKSWADSQRYLERDVLPQLGDVALADLTTSAIRDWHAKREHAAPIAARGALGVLSSMCGWAVRSAKLDANPCRDVQGKQAAERERVLSKAELRRLWAATATFGDDGLALRLSLLTAMRVGEARTLRRGWVEDDWCTLPGAYTKTEKPRRLYLSDASLDCIEAGSGDGDHVFALAQKMSTAKAKAIWAAAEIEGAQARDARRTAATGMAELGTPRLIVSLVLGHSVPGITSVYDRYTYAKEKQDALERWADRLVEIVEGPSVVRLRPA